MASGNITVSVENAIHEALREVAQSAWSKYGICLKNAIFSWDSVSLSGNNAISLVNVEAITMTVVIPD